MNKSLILIQCRDEVGLVALISGVLAHHHLNITAMREFVDETSNHFFARIDCVGAVPEEKLLYAALREKLPELSEVVINPNPEKRIAILVTKEYHCLADSLVRNHFNTLGAKVCCVAGNYDHLESFTKGFNVPFHHIDHQNKSKEEFEKELLDVLTPYKPDYVILAKFMRILSPEFVDRFRGRIINIHHSFLPAFIGASPYRQAFERGVKLIGATAHFVTSDLDEGPIIMQRTIPVNHTFGVAEMVKAGKEIEKAVLSRAMQLVFEDRVFINGNKTIIFE
ncbi:formyltetrahydrofolate deformylase [Arcticibacter tournemirensis]|uniref:Formyltetrahydrofolate deformylase n=1 Tax=Arcticibacter tournemirensis TaxID=699437 RepID=A0A4Q0MGJ5_9SPHI|nr:formyltetrahydrofolate deformylase [Arcticibacter tournemirensis]RXF72504.1 formyltetrahydrofolate deformylase [Arcticibacter tournemirensis]